jgi:hypothetical protein
MVSAFILFFSLAGLFQFFVSYCRSLVEVYSKVEISRQACKVAGLEGSGARAEQFRHLSGLIELCPNPVDDRFEIHAIGAYYRLLSLFRASRSLAPALATWADHERTSCAHFLAVSLDRRLGPNGSAEIT